MRRDILCYTIHVPNLFPHLPVFGSGASFATGYKHLLNQLFAGNPVSSVTDEFSVGSAWGERSRDFRELIGLSFVVDTDEVLLVSDVRPVNVEYAVKSSEWILAGRNDLESMVALNPRGEMFSADGFTLSGAFGYRLRVKHHDQVMACVNLLREDVSSRRAIAFIGDAEDTAERSLDFPCAASMQFMVRDGKLVSVVTMRSQSLFGVFPYDVVNFRFIHRFVADQLSVDAGGMVVSCNSAHIYEEEVGRIEKFLGSDFKFVNSGVLPFDEFVAVSPT